MEVLNISQLAQDVWDGKESPLKAYGIAKNYLKQATEAMKAIEEAALEEASKYEKSFEFDGFKFEQRNGSIKHSYDHIQSWIDNREERKEIERACKASYNAFKINLTAVNEDGEVMELPKVSQGKDSLIVKSISSSLKK